MTIGIAIVIRAWHPPPPPFKVCRCTTSSSDSRQVEAIQVYWKVYIGPTSHDDHEYAIYFI